MAVAIGTIPHGFAADEGGSIADSTIILLPPQNGGAFGWGNVYVSFGTDFWDARLRVAIWNDNAGSWRDQIVNLDRLGGRVNVNIQDGDSKVSVGRQRRDENDPGNQPIGWLLETALKP